jgi:hypothetical protein
MKTGQPIEGRLLRPIYVHGTLVVPQNAPVLGTVISLAPDSAMRIHGRLHGDFTPFHIARVEFNQLMLSGHELAISASSATTGAPGLQLVAAGVTSRRSLLSRYWTQAKGDLRDRIDYFVAPGLGDRALQALYHQLPYQPERIEANTMWSFDLSQPVALPSSPPVAQAPTSPPKVVNGKLEIWSIHALLTSNLTSATAKPGDVVKAVVVEPVFDQANNLVVPQDSMLVGRVTTAKAARSLGRNGKLRFTFQQVVFPQGSGPALPVEGSLSGATAQSAKTLSLDAEGTVSPRHQASAIAPLLLTALAGRALDDDSSLTVGATVASNGFGLVGRIAGIAAGSRNLAAGIGYYAAALSFYENFLHRGSDVVFNKDTWIEIETTPLRTAVLASPKQ